VSAADVGIFYAVKEAVLPDVLPEHRCFGSARFSRMPRARKIPKSYLSNAEIKVPYYVIYDPDSFSIGSPHCASTS